MRNSMATAIAGLFVMLAVGCGGGGAEKPGAEKTGGGKSFEAALKACERLGIAVTSKRPGQIINGVIPESTETGQVLVNMTFSGSKVKIEFFNAPSQEGWEAAWRNKIVRAIEGAGSSR